MFKKKYYKYKIKYLYGGSLEEVEKCAICQDDIIVNESNYLTTTCNHKFHHTCLLKWCNEKEQTRQTDCPMCRFDIKETCNKLIKDIPKYKFGEDIESLLSYGYIKSLINSSIFNKFKLENCKSIMNTDILINYYVKNNLTKEEDLIKQEKTKDDPFGSVIPKSRLSNLWSDIDRSELICLSIYELFYNVIKQILPLFKKEIFDELLRTNYSFAEIIILLIEESIIKLYEMEKKAIINFISYYLMNINIFIMKNYFINDIDKINKSLENLYREIKSNKKSIPTNKLEIIRIINFQIDFIDIKPDTKEIIKKILNSSNGINYINDNSLLC